MIEKYQDIEYQEYTYKKCKITIETNLKNNHVLIWDMQENVNIPNFQYNFKNKNIENIQNFIMAKIDNFTNKNKLNVFDNPNLIWDEFNQLVFYKLIELENMNIF